MKLKIGAESPSGWDWSLWRREITLHLLKKPDNGQPVAAARRVQRLLRVPGDEQIAACELIDITCDPPTPRAV